jgi:hypothetical protein
LTRVWGVVDFERSDFIMSGAREEHTVVAALTCPQCNSIEKKDVATFLKEFKLYLKRTGSIQRSTGTPLIIREPEDQVSQDVVSYLAMMHKRIGISHDVKDMKGELLLSCLAEIAGLSDTEDMHELVHGLEGHMVAHAKGASTPLAKVRQQFMGVLDFMQERSLEPLFMEDGEWREAAAKKVVELLVKLAPGEVRKQLKPWLDFNKVARRDPVLVHGKIVEMVEEMQRWQPSPTAAPKQEGRGTGDRPAPDRGQEQRRKGEGSGGGDRGERKPPARGGGGPPSSTPGGGQMRPPVAPDRPNIPFQAPGRCDNCGRIGHQWRQCRDPLRERGAPGAGGGGQGGAPAKSGGGSGGGGGGKLPSAGAGVGGLPAAGAGGKGKQSSMQIAPEFACDFAAVTNDGLATLSVSETLLGSQGRRGGTTMVPILFDGGASLSTGSRKVVDKLQELCPQLVVEEPVPQPFHLTAANGGTIIVTTQTCPLTLVIQTVHGNVRLDNVRLGIVESDEHLVVLGRGTCARLGVVPAVEQLAAKAAAGGGARQHSMRMSMTVEGLRESASAARDAKDAATREMEEPPNPDELPEPMNVGDEKPRETDAFLEKALDDAVENGLPPARREAWRDAVWEYRDMFRSSMGGDPPANVEPFRNTLKEGAQHVGTHFRTYSPSKYAWLSFFMGLLMMWGLVFENPQAVWASAPLILAKGGGERLLQEAMTANSYRFVVDLRAINAVSVKCPYPQPTLETIFSALAGAVVFGKLDLQAGYWQIPLHPDCWEQYTIITEDGLFTPTRMLQGSLNATAHFQAQLRKVLAEYYGTFCLLYVDDLLIWAKDEAELLERSRLIWGRLHSALLKCAASKLVLYTERILWCGRYADGEGVWHDPQRVQGLLDMREPESAGELMQYLCALGWMRLHLPMLAEVAGPLQRLLEQKMKGATTRTKAAAAQQGITSEEWSPECAEAWEATRRLLTESVKLAHHKTSEEGYATLVFTDASDLHWGVMVTQVPTEDLGLPVEQMRHEPKGFLSGSFKNSELNWSVTDKEAWAIVVAYRRLGYLLWGEVFLFTDHRNLAYVFTPSDMVSKATSQRLARWAVFLGQYRYTIYHIAGELNVWADLLSRWITVPVRCPSRQMMLLQGVGSAVFAAPSGEFPTAAIISQRQEAAMTRRHSAGGGEGEEKDFSQSDDGIYYVERKGSRRVWIPDDDEELQQRLLVIAHCGEAGHRGVDATMERLKLFWWGSMREDTRLFVSRCLNCVDGRLGEKMPRPLGELVHGKEPNQVLHFDFLHLGASELGESEYKYVLVLYDDFSEICHLEACITATMEMAARGLMEWASIYGWPQVLVSDNASHFKNQVVERVCALTGTEQRFTVANTPFSNGTGERMVGEVVRAFRSTLLDREVSPKDWVEVIKPVQLALNTSFRKRLGATPFEIMFGRQARTALTAALIRDGDEGTWGVEPVDLSDIQTHCKKLVEELRNMHRSIAKAHEKQRKRGRELASKGSLPNFAVGDFVLKARVRQAGRTAKLAATWCGPYRITAAAEGHVFEVQHLLTGELSSVHVSRLAFYADSSLEVTTELKEHVQLVEEQGLFEMERLVAVRKCATGLEAKVAWAGFEEAEWTWEPLEQLLEDRRLFVTRQLAALNLAKPIKVELAQTYNVRV